MLNFKDYKKNRQEITNQEDQLKKVRKELKKKKLKNQQDRLKSKEEIINNQMNEI